MKNDVFKHEQWGVYPTNTRIHLADPSRRNHLTKQNGDVTDTNRNQLSAGRCRAESCLVCALNHPFWHVISTSVKT